VYYVYILRCKDGSLYTGITTDVRRRLKEHQKGSGGSYTRAHGAVKMLYKEAAATRSAALKREAEIKRFRREKKLKLIR